MDKQINIKQVDVMNLLKEVALNQELSVFFELNILYNLNGKLLNGKLLNETLLNETLLNETPLTPAI